MKNKVPISNANFNGTSPKASKIADISWLGGCMSPCVEGSAYIPQGGGLHFQT